MKNPRAEQPNHRKLCRAKVFFCTCIASLLFCFASSFQARAIDLYFANLTNTAVSFSGGAFTFTTNSTGYQFDITSVSGSVGDSVGLDGYITPGGPFTIGTVMTYGSLQTATVAGTGILHITDQNNMDLTGTIQWDTITTIGTGGVLDLSGSINLTGLSYMGVNSDLSTLASAGSAADVVTFQFVPAKPLSVLKTTTASSSYSGTIGADVTPVPEPGTLALAGLAGLLAWSFGRKK